MLSISSMHVYDFMGVGGMAKGIQSRVTGGRWLPLRGRVVEDFVCRRLFLVSIVQTVFWEHVLLSEPKGVIL